MMKWHFRILAVTVAAALSACGSEDAAAPQQQQPPQPQPQPTGNGTATLSWSAPTQNSDGSALTDLAGYRIYQGTSSNALNQMTQVPGAGVASYSFTQLASGPHYFAITAYTSAGAESARSDVRSKTIP